MAHDDCHSSRLLKKREERNEKPQESESYSISSCVSYSIGTVTRSSTCTRILKRYVFVPEIENSTEICKDKKMKTNTILFRKAFLSFSSFFSLFFFFFLFEIFAIPLIFEILLLFNMCYVRDSPCNAESCRKQCMNYACKLGVLIYD